MLGSEGGAALLAALPSLTPQLQMLDLRECRLGAAGACALARALARLPSLQKLGTDGFMHDGPSSSSRNKVLKLLKGAMLLPDWQWHLKRKVLPALQAETRRAADVIFLAGARAPDASAEALRAVGSACIQAWVEEWAWVRRAPLVAAWHAAHQIPLQETSSDGLE
jgi:hypothetical protein